MPQTIPKADQEGFFEYPERYNRDAGVWEKFDGHEGHSRLKTKFVSVTSAGLAILTTTSTQKAYITFLQAQPATRGKTIASLHFLESAGAGATLTIMQVYLQQMTGGLATSRTSFQNLYKQGDGRVPFIVVGSSKRFVAKSRPNAITSKVTCSWYFVTTTGDK